MGVDDVVVVCMVSAALSRALLCPFCVLFPPSSVCSLLRGVLLSASIGSCSCAPLLSHAVVSDSAVVSDFAVVPEFAVVSVSAAACRFSSCTFALTASTACAVAVRRVFDFSK